MLRPTWLFLAVALCALGEVGAHEYFKYRSPSQSQWRSLAPTIRALTRPTDCVQVAPKWCEPLARAAFGDATMPIEKLARADNDSCERVIQIGLFGQDDAATLSWPESARQVVGPFRISTRNNSAWQPLRYSFIEHVDKGSLGVTVGRNEKVATCPMNEQAALTAGGLGGDPTAPRHRYQCPEGRFHWVGVTIIDDEQYYPRRCIWAPPSQLGPLVLRFGNAMLGRKLVGHAGGPWLMVRDGVGPPVTLVASINQKPLGQAQSRDIAGWTRFEWETRDYEGTSAEVTLTITGTPNVEQRFCFTLDAR